MEMTGAETEIRKLIRAIPDYPKRGIVFRDLTPLMKDKATFSLCIKELSKHVPSDTDYIIGVESRGFIIGAALAYALGIGFVPVRKEGKLPHKKIWRSYELEYGTATLEVHRDALEKGSKVVIVDDLLATGGTAKATAELVEELGGKVSTFLFVVELSDLGGRKKLSSNVVSLVKY